MSEPLEMPVPGTILHDADMVFLLEYLRTHDVFCPLCKYNLRNLTQPRCPECGREIKLTVGLTQPYLAGLLLFLVPTLLSAGAGVISLTSLIFITAHDGIQGFQGFADDIWRHPLIGFIFFGPILSLIPAIVFVVRYRTFLRLPKGAQFGWAVVAWIWDGALMVAFLAALLRF